MIRRQFRSKMLVAVTTALLLVVVRPNLAEAAEEWQMGVAASKPVALGIANFDRAIEDPANSFWFLKFYAPWCGHCKRLAPVLENVAPQTAGKMSIGKIDCTTERKLCDRFQVRGYPTLKFSLDGTIHDYSGSRNEPDLLAFSRKMTRPAVRTMASVTDALEYSESQEADTGVVFLAYDPTLNAANLAVDKENIAQATLLTQVLGQVARKHVASAEFFVLIPEDTSAEKDANLDPDKASKLSTTTATAPFICRVEPGAIPVRCFDGIKEVPPKEGDEDDDDPSSRGTKSWNVDSVALNKFVKENHVATVSPLGPHNFGTMSRKGRPLVIGVVKTWAEQDKVQEMTKALSAAAIQEPFASKYYFGWMDGGQFYRFLEQFNIDKNKDLPLVFVLDQTEQVFWNDVTYFAASSSSDDASLQQSTLRFLKDVTNGTLESQVTKAGSKGIKRVWIRILSAITQHKPWSIVLLVLVLVSVAIAIATVLTQEHTRQNTPSTAMPDSSDKGAASAGAPTAQERQEETESKKDK